MTQLFHVDAFTDLAFSGNPAAVCLLDAPSGDSRWMQAVAAEMNLSETAFVAPRPDGDLDLRWFTPTVEVDLCGHATLASAHVMWESGRLAHDSPARFHTRSGLLVAHRAARVIELDLPARPVTPTTTAAGIEHLGAPAILATFDNGHQLVVEVPDAEAVRGVTPDFTPLAAAADRLWVVTAPAPPGSAADFVSRSFGPRYGIDEDPVTGSAHCALGPLWAQRLGRDDVVGHQISPRGGTVAVRVRGDRVTLGGQAVTVSRGDLLA
ncbi:MAG TPA: PhzF family phenazine biosynthesis protein [Acidimicrobiia bacterium]|nr:PhzF family phenazine biosynthesis protein [Acidimicrobiia bacterium]